MKTILLLAFIGICAAKYTTMYDNVNIEQILKTQRLLSRYVDCLKWVPNACNKEGMKLREVLPDALLHGCKECSEQQKKNAKRVANYMIECHPKWWSELAQIYDPRGTYQTTHQAELKAQDGSKSKNIVCYH